MLMVDVEVYMQIWRSVTPAVLSLSLISLAGCQSADSPSVAPAPNGPGAGVVAAQGRDAGAEALGFAASGLALVTSPAGGSHFAVAPSGLPLPPAPRFEVEVTYPGGVNGQYYLRAEFYKDNKKCAFVTPDVKPQIPAGTPTRVHMNHILVMVRSPLCKLPFTTDSILLRFSTGGPDLLTKQIDKPYVWSK